MSSEIIIAIISLIGTLFGSLSGVVISAKLTNFRLEQLERKVDKHNNFAERIPVIQLRIDSLEDQLDNMREKR